MQQYTGASSACICFDIYLHSLDGGWKNTEPMEKIADGFNIIVKTRQLALILYAIIYSNF